MPEIKPFNGVIFNTRKVDIAKVVSPPYDVIPADLQESLYSIDEHNFVRLILGKIFSDDSEQDNRYLRAKKTFQDWLSNDILSQDSEPVFYVYEMEFVHKGEKRKFAGFVGLCKVEDYFTGSVKPHERTFRGPIQDRFKLIEASQTNFEPIYCIYFNKKISSLLLAGKSEKVFEFDYDSVKHRLIRLSDKKIVSEISSEMRKTPLYIADGHHRYQTALEYSKYAREKLGSNAKEDLPSDFIMMLIADINNNSVLILPTHRIVKHLKVPLAELIKKLENYFIVEEIGNFLRNAVGQLESYPDEHAFVMAINGNFYLLRAKENFLDFKDAEKSDAWNSLDVSIFDNLIMNKVLGMHSHDDKEVLYSRDASDAVKLAGKEGIAFLLNSTKLEDVMIIADNKEAMPHKSTFFYPKPLSGLVVYKY